VSSPNINTHKTQNNQGGDLTRYDVKDEFPNLPDRISGLARLAYNLWWGWNPEGREIFVLLDRRAWNLSDQNPIKMLRNTDSRTLEFASTNPRFLRHYDAMMARLDRDLDISSGWFYTTVANPKELTIAYFSAEYGLHSALPVYAGGLGFLAGDFLKECSDLGVPTIGVGFMYPQGYLRQKINPDGWQLGACEILNRNNAPIRRVRDDDGAPILVEIPVTDPPIYVEVWKVNVGRATLYLMDTDVELNDSENRRISDRLYTGDLEGRLRQEIVLGVGGTIVLEALGIKPNVFHLNEGHPAFAILERIRQKVTAGMNYEDAVEQVRATTVFTTHTPVPAGHDKYPRYLIEKHFGSYLQSFGLSLDDFYNLGVDPDDPESGFNVTAFALRMSAHRNCVSKKHQEVSRIMWQQLWPNQPLDEVPIDYVTNGVHVPSWIDRRLGNDIFNRYLGRDWLENHDNPLIWGLVDDIPDEILWRHHLLMKRMLIDNIKDRAREKWQESGAEPKSIISLGVLLEQQTLTLGFARRFASYKRATLLFRDAERLRKIVNNPRRPVQIIFAGKAHPDDEYSKQLLQQVFNAARDQGFGGRIAFVEDYDQYLAHYLVHGVDVWVNNPLPPMEACGTSGMKATLNGVPQLSIFDGWWVEGYNEKNGWGFEGQGSDEGDSAVMYDILEKKIVPLYYKTDDRGIPHGWVRMMKETIKQTGPHFSARRMVKEYMDKFYRKALEASIVNECKPAEI